MINNDHGSSKETFEKSDTKNSPDVNYFNFT